MTEKLTDTACARLCLLTHIAWDASMPPPFSRMAVRQMMECGALTGLVLRRTDALPKATFERAEALLTRTSDAFACMQAYEQQGYRLLLREETGWPKALNKLGRREPLFLFIKGNASLLERRAAAVAGSREIAKPTRETAARLGRMLADEGLAMACGGARGVDRAAQDALLEAGGSLILVPAVTGEQACARDNETAALRENRLLLVCETLPDAPFSAAKALARNHTIYALGEAAIVVAARKGVGGSWRGATAALCGGFTPVYVPDGNGADFAGNRALFEYGAQKIDLSGEKTIAEQIAANQQMTLFDGIKGDV